jgi:hypothetical protein
VAGADPEYRFESPKEEFMRKYLLGGGLAVLLVFALVGTARAESVFQNAPGTLSNEVQDIDLGGATGGTFTLAFEGQTTGNIAYNATAGDVQTALEGLSNIAPGDVDVSTNGDFSVEFIGNLANTDVDEMIIDGAALTGGSGAVVTTTTLGVGLHDQGLDSAVEDGGNQLTARSGPLSLFGQSYLAPTRTTKKAGRVRLRFDEGIKLNENKFPTCDDPAGLESTSTADAKKICGEDSQVSIDGPAFSEATAAIKFGTTIAVVNPVVTAFNGPRNANGNPTLILHTFLAGPPSNTTVLNGELTRDANGRTLLDVDKIPPLAGGLGALTDFFATLNAETKDKKAINKAKKQEKKAKKKYKKAKKKVKKAKNKKKKKKAKKKAKKAKKKYKKAKKKTRKAKAKRINYIEAKCTGGSYETEGIWNLGRYEDNTDLNSFVTEFTIQGQDSVGCKSNGDTVVPFDSGR